MARLAVVPNPLDLSDVRWHTVCGPYIDWLVKAYPRGFPGPHSTVINGERLAVADYDRVLADNDEVALILAPAAPVAVAFAAAFSASAIASTIATAVITAIASVAINYVVNAIFGPDDVSAAPQAVKGGSTRSPGSVYNLAVPTNSTRLGDPVPVIYGDVIAVPDIAAQPYSYYNNNDQFVCMRLCLGQGDYTIKGVQVESTDVAQLQGGVFTYRFYSPAQHGQNWGTIQADGLIYENVDTSAEVENQELKPAALKTYTGQVTANDTIQIDQTPTFDTGTPIAVKNVGISIGTFTVTNKAGKTITVSPATLPTTDPDDHTWFNQQGTSRATDDHTAKTLTITNFDAIPFPGVGSRLVVQVQYSNGTATYTGTTTSLGGTSTTAPSQAVVTYTTVTGTQLPPIGSTAWQFLTTSSSDFHSPHVSFTAPNPTAGVGPFSVSVEDCTQILVNLTFPSGLYKVDKDTGDLKSHAVQIRFTITPIDAAGAPSGASITRTETITRSDNTPQRLSFWYPVATGRYQVAADRVTAAAAETSTQDRIIWTGLCGILNNTGAKAYGQTTMMSVRIKATNGIANSAINRIGVRCTRQGLGTVADAYKDIVTNTVYGAARAASELDTAQINKLTAPFNGIFDFKSNVWEAVSNACAVDNAKAMPLYATFSSVRDVAQTTPKFAFTLSNIVRDSVQSRYLFDAVGELDGFEVEYRDPIYFQANYALYPTTSVNPQAVNLFGCTSATRAAAHAKRLFNRRQYRRQWVAWTTELEGHLPQIGDLVSVDHPLLGGKVNLILNLIEPDKDSVRMEGFKYDARVYA